jgi:hypothetical protein
MFGEADIHFWLVIYSVLERGVGTAVATKLHFNAT